LKRKLRHQLSAVAIAILVAVFQIFADPFGLASTTDRLSSLLFSALSSPFYGSVIDGDSNTRRLKGQDNIVVLLYDDDYLTAKEWQWPISPRIHKQWFRRIAEAKPDAIFVDLNYVADSDKRSNKLAGMVTATNLISEESGIPVFYAGTLAKPVPTFNDVSPTYSALIELQAEDYQYNLQETAFDGQRYDTAAYALYKQWCKSRSCEPFSDELKAQTMFVQWGYAPSQEMASYYEKTGVKCQKSGHGIVSQAWQSLSLFVIKALNGFSDNWQPSCLYHTHSSLQLIEQMDARALEEFIQGKVVLIGASLQQFPDLSRSSVHGYVSGVFWHAAALDNLIELGSNFLQDDQSNLSDIQEAIGTAIVLLIFMLFSTHLDDLFSRRNDDSGSPIDESADDTQMIINFLFGAAVVLVLSMIVSTMIYFYHSAPTNWIGIAALLFIVNPEPFRAVVKINWFRFGRPRISVLEAGSHKNNSLLRKALSFAVAFTLLWLMVIGVVMGPPIYFSLTAGASVWSYALLMMSYGCLSAYAIYLLWSRIKGFKSTADQPYSSDEVALH
jgi:CHASE2 domain-containing sensor protein